MKSASLSILATGLFLLSPSVFAGDTSTFRDTARVINVSPRYVQVSTPEKRCRMESAHYESSKSAERGVGGAILGGIAGAILGNQIGGGSGNTAATAAGAIAGAMVGDRMENDGNATYDPPVERQTRHCTVVNRMEERADGYEVTYQYLDRTFTAITQTNPGSRMRINVSVTPLDDQY